MGFPLHFSVMSYSFIILDFAFVSALHFARVGTGSGGNKFEARA